MGQVFFHIDLDAFFASVEILDNPSYKGKPIIIGTPGPRHVASTCSYEARKYGVHSAMPSRLAMELCPELVFVEGRLSHYRAVSREIHEIFRRYTDVVEPLSLDEAYLDVTHNKLGLEYGVEAARRIKAENAIIPNDGERRVTVIRHAQNLNPMAQNALLKELEFFTLDESLLNANDLNTARTNSGDSFAANIADDKLAASINRSVEATNQSNAEIHQIPNKSQHA